MNILNTNTAGISGFSRCVNDISVFLDVTQCVLVISYWRLGTNFLPHFQEPSSPRSCLLGLQVFKQSSRQTSRNPKICLLWLLAPWKGFTGCLETSITNYYQCCVTPQKIEDLITFEVKWGLKILLFNNFMLFTVTHGIYRSSGLITLWMFSNQILFFVAEIPFESFSTASRQDDAQESFGHYRQEWADTEEGQILAILREGPQGSVMNIQPL